MIVHLDETNVEAIANAIIGNARELPQLRIDRDRARAERDANAVDAAEMRELRALVAEPLTVERLARANYERAEHGHADPWDEQSELLRSRWCSSAVFVARIIFAAQRSERAVQVARLATSMADAIAANQRAAVAGLGAAETFPDVSGPSMRLGSEALDVDSTVMHARALANDRDREKARADEAEQCLTLEMRRSEKADGERLSAIDARNAAELRAMSFQNDAAKWREATTGVGDVERYARAYDEAYLATDRQEGHMTARLNGLRAVLAMLCARATSDGAAAHAAVESAKPGPWGAKDIVRAALDFACSDVADAARDGASTHPDCFRNPTSSRMCERGTKSCTIPHGEPPPPFVPVDTERLTSNKHGAGYGGWCNDVHDVVLDLARRVNAARLR